jgi:hypothetical protein
MDDRIAAKPSCKVTIPSDCNGPIWVAITHNTESIAAMSKLFSDVMWFMKM